MKARHLAAGLAALSLCASLSACSGTSSSTTSAAPAGGTTSGTASTAAAASGETLVVYTNSNAEGRAEWLSAEAKKVGLNIQVVGLGGGELTNKLLAEKNNPVADVVFGLNNMFYEQLEAASVLEDYTPSWSGEVDPAMGDDDASKSYFPIVQQRIFLAYNADKYTDADAPKEWKQVLTDPKYKGKFQSETGLGGATTRLIFASILEQYKDPNGDLGISKDGWALIKAYFDNGSPAEKGVDLYARIADGKVDMGQMQSSNKPRYDKQYKLNTKAMVPAAGVPYAIEQVALVKGTKKAADAKKFIDWFGGAEMQAAWSAKFNSMPVNKGAIAKTDPEIVKFHDSLPQQKIDWTFAMTNMDKWIEKIELEYMK